MAGSAEPVLHLVHPYPVSWSVVSATASELLRIPSVPYLQWLNKLQDAARDAAADAQKDNPALKLIDFFEKDMGAASEVVLATDRAIEVSKTLKDAGPLERADVERWIHYWHKIGFLRC